MIYKFSILSFLFYSLLIPLRKIFEKLFPSPKCMCVYVLLLLLRFEQTFTQISIIQQHNEHVFFVCMCVNPVHFPFARWKRSKSSGTASIRKKRKFIIRETFSFALLLCSLSSFFFALSAAHKKRRETAGKQN